MQTTVHVHRHGARGDCGAKLPTARRCVPTWRASAAKKTWPRTHRRAPPRRAQTTINYFKRHAGGRGGVQRGASGGNRATSCTEATTGVEQTSEAERTTLRVRDEEDADGHWHQSRPAGLAWLTRHSDRRTVWRCCTQATSSYISHCLSPITKYQLNSTKYVIRLARRWGNIKIYNMICRLPCNFQTRLSCASIHRISALNKFSWPWQLAWHRKLELASIPVCSNGLLPCKTSVSLSNFPSIFVLNLFITHVLNDQYWRQYTGTVKDCGRKILAFEVVLTDTWTGWSPQRLTQTWHCICSNTHNDWQYQIATARLLQSEVLPRELCQRDTFTVIKQTHPMPTFVFTKGQSLSVTIKVTNVSLQASTNVMYPFRNALQIYTRSP